MGGEQNVKCSIQIDEGCLHGVFNGPYHGNDCGKMNDVIDALKQEAQASQVANVGAVKVDLAPDLSEVFLFTSREIVDNANGFAALYQLFHDV
jgi:hypothetical protein